ncbi:MAG: sigma 54-interacting transcriptional regulator [Nannocystaceae bacterium]|nr:sigma 54-interacting transcriptional regulator [Nannocystaceae bacterium]
MSSEPSIGARSPLPKTQEGAGPEIWGRLVIMDGARPRVELLRLGESYVVGRSSLCQVCVRDPGLSREHLAIHVGSVVEVEDLGSSNGTLASGQKLAPGVRVIASDTTPLDVGGVVMVLQASAETTRRRDPPMDVVRTLALRAAPSDLPLLFLGETGVGKTRLAREVHEASHRAEGPFVTVDCGTLGASIVESELFGHEAGAFTGASQARIGVLESARGGTVFIDEIGELPNGIQTRLLRAVQAGVVRRLGGAREHALDVRFISATHRDVAVEVSEGRFREDLYYRLAGLVLRLPPLRLRQAEIPELLRAVIEDLCTEVGAHLPGPLDPQIVQWAQRQPWPGNVRQLRNVVLRTLVLHGAVEVGALARALDEDGAHSGDGNDERQRIAEALEACAGNQTQAAKRLGISRRTLVDRLDRYGFRRPRKPRS